MAWLPTGIRRRVAAAAAGIALGFAGCVSAGAATLTVEVTGIEAPTGAVHVAVYDDPDTFPDDDGMVDETQVPVKGDSIVATFEGLKPGRYAVATYHDKNGNGDFDQGPFGIPLEDYGFSNDAPVFFGPPSFADASFELPPEGTRIVIHLDK